ncbi:MAG: hypothetical protein JSU07_06730 [Bacteroidetes bacterium]|nr:hypothetical protein [Bacteroidota bacterium]
MCAKNKLIYSALSKERSKLRNNGEKIILNVHSILNNDLYSTQKVLSNLESYNKNNEFLDEELIETENIFTQAEIKALAIKYRLRFIDTKNLKQELPFEISDLISQFNDKYGKDLKHYKMLSSYKNFKSSMNKKGFSYAFFIQTNHSNFYLAYEVNASDFSTYRKIKMWPMRNFETLFLSVFLFSLIITSILPNQLIALNVPNLPYFNGFRFGAFFHILIFNLGVTIFLAFSFGKNLSSGVWNSYKSEFE